MKFLFDSSTRLAGIIRVVHKSLRPLIYISLLNAYLYVFKKALCLNSKCHHSITSWNSLSITGLLGHMWSSYKCGVFKKFWILSTGTSDNAVKKWNMRFIRRIASTFILLVHMTCSKLILLVIIQGHFVIFIYDFLVLFSFTKKTRHVKSSRITLISG